MNNLKIKNKKIIFIIIFLIVVTSTIAFLYSTDTFQNIFVAASYKVVVTEEFVSPSNWTPGDETDKTVTLKNEGTVPIKVRVKLEEEWKDSNNQDLPLTYNDENVAIINFSNEDDYIYKDGYYYYDLPLQPGETTSSIIDSVSFNPNYSGTITCIENNDSTHTCSSSDSGYEGGTYKLTITIEGVQDDYYVQAWNLSGIVERATFYNLLKNEATNSGLAREYTGEHHDSFTEEPSQKIYHWYANNTTESNQILDKNNVIFANHCWMIIRTTDTGGVKLLYNGEAENNQCLDNRGSHLGFDSRSTGGFSSTYWYGTDFIYDKTTRNFVLSGDTDQLSWNSANNDTSIVGKYTCKSTSVNATCTKLYYIEGVYGLYDSYSEPIALVLNGNSSYSIFGKEHFGYKNSLSYMGYMYNKQYIESSEKIVEEEDVLFSGGASVNYWYSNDITWGTPRADEYSLVNPYKISSAADYPSLVGKYTFLSSQYNHTGYTASTVRYIVDNVGSTLYYMNLRNGESLSDVTISYTYGDSFVDNGNGTFTINNANTFNNIDWYTNYSNINVGDYICRNAVNNTCSDLLYVTWVNNKSFSYMQVSNSYKYAKNFIYDGEKYILKDNQISFWNINADNNKTKLNNAHYTCWNDSGECSSISYIFYFGDDKYNYVNLNDGESIEDAINNILFDDNVNTKNSVMKSAIDLWYERYMIGYSDYLEDTIYCNDRSIYDLGGWSPTGIITSRLTFGENRGSSDLRCPKITDRFSVSNSKAKLKYKVGLLTKQELSMTKSLITMKEYNTSYYLLTPQDKDSGTYYSVSSYDQTVSAGDVYYTTGYRGVRPAISLRPGIEYSSGDGSMANPYIVDTD